MKTKIVFLIVFNWVYWGVGYSQAVFAPIVGAEWNYSFTKENITSCSLPSRDAFDGLATYNYVKDTLINGILCKKIDGIEKIKYRCGDTQQYIFKLYPLYIYQKNDSVFMLRQNTFIFIYLFPKVLNNEFMFEVSKNSSYPVKYTDTSKITSISAPFQTLKTNKFIVGKVQIIDIK